MEGPAVGWLYDSRGAGRETGADFLAGEEVWIGAGRAAGTDVAGRDTGASRAGRDIGGSVGVGLDTGGLAAGGGGGLETGEATGRG